MKFLLFTFGSKEYFNVRSCQNLNETIQQMIEHCQSRNYISTVKEFVFSLYCEKILSILDYDSTNIQIFS